MNLFGLMDVSGSALKAERVRAEVVASNMANAETTKTEEGGPYQRKHVVFQAEGGGAGSFQQSLLSRISGGYSLAGSGLLGNNDSADAVAGGVSVTSVIADQSAPLRRFDPGHPDAGADGFVAYPDINPLTEMVDLMGATRAYGMNASAVQAEKSMVTASLELLK
jgi:flagellar basal-body rod protein FlgC